VSNTNYGIVFPQRHLIGTKRYRHFLGLDLGRESDFSALVLLTETQTLGDHYDPATWEWAYTAKLELPWMERLPLGTPYTEVARRVLEVTRKLAAHPKKAGDVSLVVDATGVGAVVMDLLKAAAVKHGPRMVWTSSRYEIVDVSDPNRKRVEVWPVTITGGAEERARESSVCVPKRDLMQTLAVMLERGELAIAEALPLSRTLINELATMRAKRTPAGKDRYEAEGECKDDLVLALALASWARNRPRAAPRGERGDGRLL
jgi:hypothetical protein